jgi:uncharacterized protein (DUF2236 family)
VRPPAAPRAAASRALSSLPSSLTSSLTSSIGAVLDAPRRRALEGFRSIVSGSAQTPDWVLDLEDGTDEGYFGPGSAVWAVHGNLATLVGGVRALLMQALHPAAVTGVDEHSTYRDDPLGRLAGTTRWLTVTTFGSRAAADRECARVRGMHRRVRGTFTGPDGRAVPYRAGDDRLLGWVHAAFTESFLVAHETFAGAVPGGADRYVGEWATAGELVGVRRAPRSVAELRELIDGYRPELAHTAATTRTVDFLRTPPLPGPAAAGYQVLYAAAASTLSDEHRRLLGLPPAGRAVPRLAASTLLRALRVTLGEGPPAEAAARRRLGRLDEVRPAG